MSEDFSSPGHRPANADAGVGRDEYVQATLVEAFVGALVEMTHAQGEDVTLRRDADWVTLVRRTPFLRIVDTADGRADLQFFYPSVPPADGRLTALPAPVPAEATHHLRVDLAALDADMIALEPLIEAAYAQNG